MYISIEKNNWGALDIKIDALNKLIEHSIYTGVDNDNSKIKSIIVSSDLHLESALYVLIEVELNDQKIMLDEAKIFKSVDEAIKKTLSIKPKNIALAYKK